MTKISFFVLCLFMAFSAIDASWNWKSITASITAIAAGYGIFKIYQKMNTFDPVAELSKKTLKTKDQAVAIPLPDQTSHQYGANIVTLSVLQQDASQALTVRGQLLETASNNLIWGDSTHTWKNIRETDGTNCAYHALKNLRLLLEAVCSESNLEKFYTSILDKNSLICKQLLDKELFIHDIALWSSIILESRTQILARALNIQESNLLKVRNIIQKEFTKFRNQLLSKNLYQHHAQIINACDGHVKATDLTSEEILILLEQSESNINDKIVVLEYDQDTKLAGSLMLGATQVRIECFKRFDKGVLGIIWSEQGFKHWISYVAIKNSGIVRLFEMNSLDIDNFQPKYRQYLLDFLSC